MVDLATKPTDSPHEPAATTPHVEWVEPAPKKRRSAKKLWLGIGIPVVAVAAAGALTIAGLTLTAPGITVLGTAVGTQTTGSAANAIASGVAASSIAVTVDGQTATFSGKELGLSVDAAGTAEAVRKSYPLWKIGEWNPGAVDAELTVDEAAATAELKDAFADLYTDPVNASVEFRDGSYVAIGDQQGRGIDTAALAADIADQLAAAQPVQALASGETLLAAGAPSISVDAEITTIDALFVTKDAEQTSKKLNKAVSGVAFTLDGDTVDEVPAGTVAEWLDIAVADDGTVDVTTKTKKIQEYATSLPEKVNRPAVDGDVVVDGSGNVSKVLTEGQDGYEIASLDGIGTEIAAQLAQLKPVEIALKGKKVEHERTERFRRALVDKSDGYSYFYETVNGGEEKLMKSFPMALGTSGHDTQVGNFTVYGQLTIQHMGSCDSEGNLVPGGRFDYCTADVPWVTYFNGDQGFHGTYWHSNFGPGAYMSHGCVNLTIPAAEWVYYFLQRGSPVSVVA